MASRNSMKEAQELKMTFETNYPNAEIRIVENGARFDILEVRECDDCETEILTAAIGEWGVDECFDCREASEAKWKEELAAGVARQNDEIAQWVAHDEMMS